MHKRVKYGVIIAWATLFTGITIQESAGQSLNRPGKTEINILMEDGILLSSSIFLPGGRDKYPTVLVRTPYDKGKEEWIGKAFNMKGIAVVIQDVRGRFKSGGDFYPFLLERADGLQTLRWIREQPWSNGVVSGWGASYVGYTQWAISRLAQLSCTLSYRSEFV